MVQTLNNSSINVEALKNGLQLRKCKHSVIYFINAYCRLYEPRNAAKGLPTNIPFKLRPKQEELVTWLLEREETTTSGLIEKSRDEGMTFLICAFFLHHWLFVPGFAGTIGSRKLELVDQLGDPKTIFAKFRYMLYQLPKWMLPKGFKASEHDNVRRIVNPSNEASVVGEGGAQAGRGGRSTIYFYDEWAFNETPETVDAAISQNSDIRIKGSSYYGPNHFYREVISGIFKVFTLRWQDNPDKDDAWYDKQKRELSPEVLAQEVDLDPFASVEGVIILGKWVQAALKIKLEEGSISTSGLDVSADGKDGTVYSHRRGGKVTRIQKVSSPEEDRPSDVEDLCRQDKTQKLLYDRLGVGSGVTTTLKKKEKKLPFKVVGVSNADIPSLRIFDDQPGVPAKERFQYWSGEQWWALRLRFEKTWERVEGIKDHPDDECISIPFDNELISQLSQPIYWKNQNDKIMVDKYGQGKPGSKNRTVKSPDHAESLMYTFSHTYTRKLTW